MKVNIWSILSIAFLISLFSPGDSGNHSDVRPFNESADNWEQLEGSGSGGNDNFDAFDIPVFDGNDTLLSFEDCENSGNDSSHCIEGSGFDDEQTLEQIDGSDDLFLTHYWKLYGPSNHALYGPPRIDPGIFSQSNLRFE